MRTSEKYPYTVDGVYVVKYAAHPTLSVISLSRALLAQTVCPDARPDNLNYTVR